MSRTDGEPLSGGTIAAILVGGGSRRLGRVKATATVGDSTLAERVHRAARSVVTEVVVVGRDETPNPLPDLPLLLDSHPERCSLSGIVAALGHAGDRSVLVLACDLPFLEPKLLRLLVDRPGDSAVTVPVVSGRPEPLVAVYRPSARPALEEALGQGRYALHRLLGSLETDSVPESALRAADADLRSFVNVNDPDDLEAARRTVGGIG